MLYYFVLEVWGELKQSRSLLLILKQTYNLNHIDYYSTTALVGVTENAYQFIYATHPFLSSGEYNRAALNITFTGALEITLFFF